MISWVVKWKSSCKLTVQVLAYLEENKNGAFQQFLLCSLLHISSYAIFMWSIFFDFWFGCIPCQLLYQLNIYDSVTITREYIVWITHTRHVRHENKLRGISESQKIWNERKVWPQPLVKPSLLWRPGPACIEFPFEAHEKLPSLIGWSIWGSVYIHCWRALVVL